MEQQLDLSKAEETLAEHLGLEKAIPKGPSKEKPLEEQRIKGASHTFPKGYPQSESEYADPNNKKYPIDTGKRVRSAISYFGRPEYYGMYKPEERKSISGRIVSAAEKFGIEVSDEWKQKHGLNSKKIEKAKTGEGSRDGKIIEIPIEETPMKKAYEEVEEELEYEIMKASIGSRFDPEVISIYDLQDKIREEFPTALGKAGFPMGIDFHVNYNDSDRTICVKFYNLPFPALNPDYYRKAEEKSGLSNERSLPDNSTTEFRKLCRFTEDFINSFNYVIGGSRGFWGYADLSPAMRRKEEITILMDMYPEMEESEAELRFEIEKAGQKKMGTWTQPSGRKVYRDEKGNIRPVPKGGLEKKEKPSAEPSKPSEEIDEIAKRELSLYAENDGTLYRQMYQPMIANMKRRIENGTFDPEKAPKLTQYFVDAAAKKYVKENTSGEKVSDIFDAPTRRAYAKELAKELEQAIRDGEYGELKMKKK